MKERSISAAVKIRDPGEGLRSDQVPTLRERQRRKRHAAILDAAGSLFRTRGFGKTTMDSIAERAEVGIATVYNYFGTKERILHELFRPALERSHAEAQKVIAQLPAKPSDGVLEILRCYRHLQEEWQDRSLLRTFASFGLGSSGVLRDLIAETDQRLRTQICTILSLYAREGMISKALRLDDATAVVFALFNQFYYRFLQRDDESYGEVFAEFARLVPTLFIAWETEPTAPRATGRRKR